MSTVCITNGLNRAGLLQRPRHQGNPYTICMYVFWSPHCLLTLPMPYLLRNISACSNTLIFISSFREHKPSSLYLYAWISNLRIYEKRNQVNSFWTTNRPDNKRSYLIPFGPRVPVRCAKVDTDNNYKRSRVIFSQLIICLSVSFLHLLEVNWPLVIIYIGAEVIFHLEQPEPNIQSKAFLCDPKLIQEEQPHVFLSPSMRRTENCTHIHICCLCLTIRWGTFVHPRTQKHKHYKSNICYLF